MIEMYVAHIFAPYIINTRNPFIKKDMDMMKEISTFTDGVAMTCKGIFDSIIKVDLNEEVDNNFISKYLENKNNKKLDSKTFEMCNFYNHKDETCKCYIFYDGQDIINFYSGIPRDIEDLKIIESIHPKVREYLFDLAEEKTSYSFIIQNFTVWEKDIPIAVIGAI